jgi:hypothetical protein
LHSSSSALKSDEETKKESLATAKSSRKEDELATSSIIDRNALDFEDSQWTDGSHLPKIKTLDEDADSNEDDSLIYDLPEKSEDFNPEVLASLPFDIRKRIIEDARRKERIKSRATYIPVADRPDLYSQTQLANFLNTR